MTEISRLQATQPLSSQPLTEQPEPKVSFKGEPDSFEKSSSNKDVAVAAGAGAASGAFGVKAIYNKLGEVLGHLVIDIDPSLSNEEKKQAHNVIKETSKNQGKQYKEELKAAKESAKTLKAESKKAEKELRAATEEAKPALQEAAEKAKAAAEKAAEDLKAMAVKIPAKYRVLTALAGAAVIGGIYAMGKLLFGSKNTNS